jgi:hypothetical protein
MNNVKNWLADLAVLPEVNVARSWLPVRSAHQCESLTLDKLMHTLQTLGPVSGWLQTAGEVVWLNEQQVQLAAHTPPLAAELFAGDTCWQLSSLPRGRWQLDRHDVNLDEQEPTHLARVVRHLAVQPGRQLMYWQLWQAGEDNAPSCSAAVLRSFEESQV